MEGSSTIAVLNGSRTMNNKAVVLLSGGLDSTTVAAIAKNRGFDICALSFRYGQRHETELQAAAAVVESMGLSRHVIADIDLRIFGGSALTDDIAVPKHADNEISEGIPVTYVPARNTIFLSFALAWAEVLQCHDIFIGVNAVDYSGYPDCRAEFIQSFEAMANLATVIGTQNKKSISIQTPLMEMSKSEIISTGIELGVDYGMTTSCYDPVADGKPCGQCDSCVLRARGFADAGVSDPQLQKYV